MASSSQIRFSGMNSGLDTESIIKSMMESYQTKIDNQQKKLTTLSWQQEAYRDVIDKLTSFKNKYFNILNKNSYLMSPTRFNQFSSTITNTTSGKEAMGLKVTTTSSSLSGDYKVSVNQLATAAKAEGSVLKSDAFSLDLTKAADTSEYTTETADDGTVTRKYNFELDVQVGSVTKTVSFEVSAEETDGKIDMDKFRADTVDALNKSLQDDFGYSGKSGAGVQGVVDADGKEWFIQSKLNADGKIEFDIGGNAIASITEKTGNFGLAQPASKVAIAAQSAVTGVNTIAIEVDGITKSVSFNGLASTFFDSKDEAGNESILALYNNLKLEAYRKEKNLTSADKVSQEELDKFAYTSTQAAKDYNSNQIVLKANAEFKSEGITFNIDKSYMTATKDGKNIDLAVTATSGGTLSLTKGRASNKYNGSTRLSEMGITGNGEEGEFTFKINGKEISVDRDGTINDLITAVKKSGAGVTLTFSNLSNKFEITANDLGNGGTINIEGNDITKALGLTDDNGDTVGFTAGQNAIININGEEIYHNSNDFTVDGTTFSFDETVALGEVYNVGIEKSYDDVKQSIKDFVNDYNQLIDDVYKHIGTARKKDSKDNYYEPLTDEEKEAMTTEQIEKWEEAAKAGVIYNDSTISGVMSQIRTALYNSVTLDDGTRFGLFNMGIKTSSDYAAHGKLEIDEDAFEAAFEKNPEAIEKLFTDSENGIMQKVNTVFDNAVRTNSQNPGSLVRKAGLATGLTATKNTMYNEMQSISNRIKQLQEKYTAKEEYWWKVFTNLESAMSDLNSQSNYLASYLGTGSN